MIFIVEGADGGGKTTLVKELQKQTNYKTYKEDISFQQRQDVIYDGYNHYKKEIEKLKDNTIIDRFFVGEFVLPHVHRQKDNRSPLNIEQIIRLASRLRDKLNTSVVYITSVPTIKFAKEVFDKRGEDVAKIEDIEYMNSLYESAAYALKLAGFQSVKYEPHKWKTTDDYVYALFKDLTNLGILSNISY